MVRILRTAGFEAYWAGGSVRDQLMGRTPKDVDIATAAPPDVIEKLFPKTREVGKAFGVMLVIDDPFVFEVATFRRDLAYLDGRRPSSVAFASAEEDARRRDFTVNGLFFDPIEKKVIDFVDGRSDLKRRVIRAIGNPDERFEEDHLRLLRAVRFACVLDFDIDPATMASIQKNAPKLGLISAERIQQELSRMLLESPRAGRVLRLLDETQLLPVFLPELVAMKGCEQPPKYHPEGDVFVHTALMLDGMTEKRDLVLALSVLLHDVAKPPTMKRVIQEDGTERIRFDGHAELGATMAESILSRLRYPNQVIEDVVHCVRGHMRFMHVQDMRRSTLRRLMGSPTFPAELELHRLDCQSSHNDLSNFTFLQEQFAAMQSEPALPEPWVSGRDIIALGIPEGREVGHWRKLAYDAQLESRFENRDALLAWLASEIKSKT